MLQQKVCNNFQIKPRDIEIFAAIIAIILENAIELPSEMAKFELYINAAI